MGCGHGLGPELEQAGHLESQNLALIPHLPVTGAACSILLRGQAGHPWRPLQRLICGGGPGTGVRTRSPPQTRQNN